MPSMEMLKRAEACVDNGVDVLNQFARRNWARRIDTNHRDGYGDIDILGQIFGDYWNGLIKIRFITKSDRIHWREDTYEFEFYPPGIYRAAECGFALGKEYMTWEALAIVWTKRIIALRG